MSTTAASACLKETKDRSALSTTGIEVVRNVYARRGKGRVTTESLGMLVRDD